MKNKEIEELLNNFQEVLDNPKYTDEMYNGKLIEFDKTYDLEQDEIKLLLSYIEQLENNRDKAIGYLEKHPCNTWYSVEKPNKDLREVKVIKHQKELLKILKGGSDE